MTRNYSVDPNMMNGVIIGTVVSTNDEKGQGRILIKIPWLEGQNQIYWASPATLLAGAGSGSWFMPEKDDEVLIAFDRSDASHAYIIGFLWNGVDKPPESDPQRRAIVTPGGHTLRFDDKEGSKKIVLLSKGELEVNLDDSSKSITLKGGGRILEMKDGQVTIS